MKKAIAITIPEPCHEDWQKMTPAKQGKHCSVCDKVVVDFTAFTKKALYNHISKGDALCGRFRKDQLDTPLYPTHTKTRSFHQAAAALLLPMALLSVTDATSQTSPEISTTGKIITVEHINQRYDSLGIGALSRKQKPSESRLIKGYVRGDNDLLPGTNVIVKGTTRGTQTDFDGHYAITVRPGETLVFSFVGFKTREITIDSQIKISVNLELDDEVIGEIIITGMIDTQDYRTYKKDQRKKQRIARRQKKENRKQ